MSLPEPLLTAENKYTLFPVQYHDIWAMHKKAEASFWTTGGVDLSRDKAQWDEKLTDDERHFISHVLAFFAASDGIVNENLGMNFHDEVQIPEARAFYTMQMAIETVHSEMYSLLIDTYITDSKEKHRLFNAIDTIPAVKQKAEWAFKWMHKDAPFGQRLIAFACIEGIFFSSSFCSIFWLKKRGLMPGLTFSNEYISRDEGYHTDFACLLYKYIRNRVPSSVIQSIVAEAVEIESVFVRDAIPVRLIGINAGSMTQYVQFVADRLLRSLDEEPLYHAENPFDFMHNLSCNTKNDQFQIRSKDYQLPTTHLGDEELTFDEDF